MQQMQSATFLPPVEKPQGFGMKLAYYFTKKRFGKVLTPLKVYAARLPTAFGMFSGKISSLDKQLTIPAELMMLLRHQVSRLNVCEFCMDIGKAEAIKTGAYSEAKFNALPSYGTSTVFSQAERAALEYATRLTRDRKIEPETFAELQRHFSERHICEIVFVVASEHVYNLTNIGLNIHSDMICHV